MNSRFRKLAVESLEGRSVLSTMVEADFNRDGYLDRATLTGTNAITVSLFDSTDGSYDVSAILTTPKNQPIESLSAFDFDGDGDQDISASTQKGSSWDFHHWLNNGDGTFGSLTTTRWRANRFNGF